MLGNLKSSNLMKKIDMKHLLRHYWLCALWASIDDDGTPLDENYTIEDVSFAALLQSAREIRDFIGANEADVLEYANCWSWECLAHDFFLTREGHGDGFWDRGLGELGKRLTTASKCYGSATPYLGDDGKVYCL